MPSFGQPDTTSFAESTSFTSRLRMLGGTFPIVSGATLDSVSIWIRPALGSIGALRIGVFAGGTADDPRGATLLEDLGQIGAEEGRNVYTLPSISGPSLPPGGLLWLAVRGTAATSGFMSTDSANARDWQSVRGRADVLGSTGGGDPTSAFPATLDGSSVSFSGQWYAWWLNYSTSGGGGNKFRPYFITG